jgi:tRNA1(Val) A37 N6-methylase TrmN6
MTQARNDDLLTDDGFLGNRLRILQPRKGFRAGVDSVLLAAAVPASEGDEVFEAGTGPGVAALCLAARVPGLRITGVEMDIGSAMLADRNARRNDLSAALRVMHGDIREALRQDLARWPRHGSFRHAFANPPYYERGRVTQSPSLRRAGANTFGPDDLEIWIKALIAMTAARGTVTVIHPAASLPRLLAAFSRGLGDIAVKPLYSRANAPASRVIVQGVKASRAPMRLLPGLVIHDTGSGYTREASLVLRDSFALPLR